MEDGAVEHNFGMGLHKDYPTQIWFNLVQRFQRRFKCDQNMPNLHNLYESAEQKIPQKNSYYM
jgi:hypothetical protein